MRIRKNGKVVNLTESDLQRISKRVLNEGSSEDLEKRVSALEKKVDELLTDEMFEWIFSPEGRKILKYGNIDPGYENMNVHQIRGNNSY